MKFKEKILIAAAILIIIVGLINGCEQPDNSVDDPTEQIKTPENNNPIFKYSATETSDGSYSLVLTAKNSAKQDIKGKVWGLELWATNGENVVPTTTHITNRIADWQEGRADGTVYYSGMTRTTKVLPSGWYAIRGSYYESGLEDTKNSSAPPAAEQYSAYTLASAKSQWHYFKVIEPCTKSSVVAELDGQKSFGGEIDENFKTLSKTCTSAVRLTIITCIDFKSLTLTGNIVTPSSPLSGQPSNGFRFFPALKQSSAEWTGISTQAGVAQNFIIPFMTEYSGSSIRIAHGWTLKDGDAMVATQKGSLVIQAPAF